MESDIPGVYLVDSLLYQFYSVGIHNDFYNHKYKSGKERKLLKSAMRYELNYLENDVFRHKLVPSDEFHINSYGKQFLIWSYELPYYAEEKSRTYYENDSTRVEDYIVQYQLNLTFVSNTYLVTLSTSVYDIHSLEDRINTLKEISNTVRIYGDDIDVAVLNNQIINRRNKNPFIVEDPGIGLKFEIPFWMNIMESNHILFSTFPDINNVSNALAFGITDKPRFDSFLSYKLNMLNSESVLKFESVPFDNERLTCYKVISKQSYGTFVCQYVFFESKGIYGFINFTATKNTYEKNLNKLNEFLETIELSGFED